jgi:hypothetical protein
MTTPSIGFRACWGMGSEGLEHLGGRFLIPAASIDLQRSALLPGHLSRLAGLDFL